MEAVQEANEGQVAHVVSMVRQEEDDGVVVVDGLQVLGQVVVYERHHPRRDLVALRELEQGELWDVREGLVEGLCELEHDLVRPQPRDAPGLDRVGALEEVVVDGGVHRVVVVAPHRVRAEVGLGGAAAILAGPLHAGVVRDHRRVPRPVPELLPEEGERRHVLGAGEHPAGVGLGVVDKGVDAQELRDGRGELGALGLPGELLEEADRLREAPKKIRARYGIDVEHHDVGRLPRGAGHLARGSALQELLVGPLEPRDVLLVAVEGGDHQELLRAAHGVDHARVLERGQRDRPRVLERLRVRVGVRVLLRLDREVGVRLRVRGEVGADERVERVPRGLGGAAVHHKGVGGGVDVGELPRLGAGAQRPGPDEELLDGDEDRIPVHEWKIEIASLYKKKN